MRPLEGPVAETLGTGPDGVMWAPISSQGGDANQEPIDW